MENDATSGIEAMPCAEEALSPGGILERERTVKKLSVAQVAQRLKYGVRQIEALERDDFGRLPGTTFVRGMIRSYAKLLDIDPLIILRELERRRIPDQMTVDLRASSIPFPDGSRRGTRMYAALSVLLIIMAAAVAYEWQAVNRLWSSPESMHSAAGQRAAGKAEGPITASQGAAALSVPQNPIVKDAMAVNAHPADAPVADPKPGSKRIELYFERESWVEIKQADGKILLSRLNAGGSRQIVEGTPPFSLIIGNAPNVRISYGEQPVDLRPYFKIDVARLTLE